MKKYLIFAITLAAMLLYFPVNHWVQGGYNLHLPVDELIPLVPVFIIPYLSGLLFWLTTLIVVNIKGKKKFVTRVNLKLAAAGILSTLIYLVIPTFVVRPEVTGTDIFSSILKSLYASDNVHNAAPSGHTFFTILCAIALFELYPRYRLLWTIISVLVIMSTVLTKQHNFLDVVTGTIFAVAIHYGSEFYLSRRK